MNAKSGHCLNDTVDLGILDSRSYHPALKSRDFNPFKRVILCQQGTPPLAVNNIGVDTTLELPKGLRREITGGVLGLLSKNNVCSQIIDQALPMIPRVLVAAKPQIV